MKKTLALILSFVLVAAISIGGTIAYFTWDAEANNVAIVGNIKVEQLEYERVVSENGNWVPSNYTGYGYTADLMQPYTEGKKLFPAVGAPAWDDRNGSQEPSGPESHQQPWSQIGAPGSNQLFDDSFKNVHDKFVFVKNTGKDNLYFRTIVAVESPEEIGLIDGKYTPIMLNQTTNSRFDIKEDDLFVEIGGTRYYLVVFTYNEILTPGEVSRPSLLQYYMRSEVTQEEAAYFGDSVEILVFTEAVQAAGFDSAADALNAAFGGEISENNHPWIDNAPELPSIVDNHDDLNDALKNGDDVILNDNIDTTAKDTAPYGNKVGFTHNGGTFNGNGNTIGIDNGGDNYAVMTSGGKIENLKIDNGFRGIVVMSPTQDVYIDNVTVLGNVCYGINTAEGDGTKTITVTNSVLSGWNSIGNTVKSVYFKDCSFVQGEYYTNVSGRLVKPYVDAVFENCDFSSKYYIDLSSLADGQTVVLRNCTVNGVKLTASNWKSLVAAEDVCADGQISIEGRNGTYMSASNVFNYVIFE